jgi:hypothetical protein
MYPTSSHYYGAAAAAPVRVSYRQPPMMYPTSSHYYGAAAAAPSFSATTGDVVYGDTATPESRKRHKLPIVNAPKYPTDLEKYKEFLNETLYSNKLRKFQINRKNNQNYR